MTDEKRQYKRVAFDAEVLMEHDGESWLCHLVDISLKGALVVFPEGIEPKVDDLYEMELRLGVEAAIKMHVKVVHQQEYLIGLEWSDIDLDSLTHLRRLLELNMNDANEMHRELSELG